MGISHRVGLNKLMDELTDPVMVISYMALNPDPDPAPAWQVQCLVNQGWVEQGLGFGLSWHKSFGIQLGHSGRS